jgi:hypothetical protein
LRKACPFGQLATHAAEVLEDGEAAVRVTRRSGRMDMIRRGFGRNLVEMDHAAPVPCQRVDIELDPLYDGLDRSVLEEFGIDPRGWIGVVPVCKCLYPSGPLRHADPDIYLY